MTKNLITALVILGTIAPASFATDWPQLRGPDRNGISAETNLLNEWPASGPTPLWRTRVGVGFSSITIHDGKLFTAGYQNGNDVVFCLDAETGEEIWTFEYPAEIYNKQHEGGPASTPTTDGVYVYICSRDARFFCLDVETGEQVWMNDLKESSGAEIPIWAFSGSPYIEGDHVFIDVGPTVAFDRKTGEIAWTSKPYPAGYSSPIAVDMHGKRVLISFPGNGAALLDIATGEELGFFTWETAYSVNSCIPIIQDDLVYISSEYGQGAALFRVDEDFSTESLWEHKDFNNHFNASILLDGYLYGYHGHYGRADGSFRCVEFETGELQWVDESINRGSVLLADGKLFILSGNGEMVLANPSPEAFTPVSRFQALGGKCWTEPAIADGKIFVRNNNRGDLVCFSLTEIDS